MIIRILEDGQYRVDERHRARLEELDHKVEAAEANGDKDGFAAALDALAAEVRRVGERLSESEFVPSDLALPAPGTPLDEVRSLLADPDAPR